MRVFNKEASFVFWLNLTIKITPFFPSHMAGNIIHFKCDFVEKIAVYLFWILYFWLNYWTTHSWNCCEGVNNNRKFLSGKTLISDAVNRSYSS